MKELAYWNWMTLPWGRALPPLTRQSLYATRVKVLGLGGGDEANQPQYTWMSDGAHSDMQVFTIWTVYWGMPTEPSRLWVMLMSLFVHTSAISTTQNIHSIIPVSEHVDDPPLRYSSHTDDDSSSSSRKGKPIIRVYSTLDFGARERRSWTRKEKKSKECACTSWDSEEIRN